jgi:hypothetical protein
MSNYFNPFDEYNNCNTTDNSQKCKMKCDNNFNNTYKSNNNTHVKNYINVINNNKYQQNIGRKYFIENNKNNNLMNFIRNYNLSDENSIDIIKYLYNNIKKEELKKELNSIFSK